MEMIDQPHRRVATRAYYTGFGVVAGNSEARRTSRGLSDYVNEFCKHAYHPWTYTASPPYIDMTIPPIPKFNWVNSEQVAPPPYIDYLDKQYQCVPHVPDDLQ